MSGLPVAQNKDKENSLHYRYSHIYAHVCIHIHAQMNNNLNAYSNTDNCMHVSV